MTSPNPMALEAKALEAATLRALGYSVAVHNDYRLGGKLYTFWLFTHPDGHWIKGEGETDADAIAQALAAHHALPPPAAGEGLENDTCQCPICGKVHQHLSDNPPASASEAFAYILRTSDDHGVCIGGKFNGWLMWLHPDGLWVSIKELERVDPNVRVAPKGKT